MGLQPSNPFYAPSSSPEDSQFNRLCSQFQPFSQHSDPLFKECFIVRHRKTKELIMVKEIECESLNDMENKIKSFTHRKERISSENCQRVRYVFVSVEQLIDKMVKEGRIASISFKTYVLKPNAYFFSLRCSQLLVVTKRKVQGLFSDSLRVVLFMDYVAASLKEEYLQRAKARQFFAPEELIEIVSGSIEAYGFLEEMGVKNDKVRLSHIYLGGGDNAGVGKLKVIDSALFATPTNTQIVLAREGIQEVFLAPQQLKVEQTRGTDRSNRALPYGPKSGVYSLGLSLIQLCLLQPSASIYDYERLSLNYQEVETRLNVVKNKYPLSVYCLLREMVERSQEARPNFKKLIEMLPTAIKNQSYSVMVTSFGANNGARQLSGQTSPLLGNQTKKLASLAPLRRTNASNSQMSSYISYGSSQPGMMSSEFRPCSDVSEVYTNGSHYIGQKKDGMKHGRGKYTYSDGSYYFGEWVCDRMHGQGQLFNEDNILEYEGGWMDDHYHGKGKLKGKMNDQFTSYEGQFSAGTIEGFGEIVYRNGDRYKGDFSLAKPHGQGRMFLADGKVIRGNWDNGRIVKTQ